MHKMDKNKDRTDLLAAGRKKLQQYRQKKDGKGSSSSRGKSSKKSGKSEQNDGDVTSATDETVESLRIQEREVEPENLIDSNMTHVDSSVSQPLDDYIVPDNDRPTVNSLLLPSQHETVGEDVNKVGSNSNVDNEHDSYSLVSNEQKTHTTIEPDMVRDTGFGTSEMIVSGGESTHATGSSPIDFSAPLSIDEGNVLLSEQDYSDVLLSQAREDQEDVYSDSKQLDQISVAELKGDERSVFPEFAESAVPSGAPLMDSTRDTEQLDASIVAGNDSGDLSVTLVKPADGFSVLALEMENSGRENLVVSSSNEEKLDVYSAPDLKDLGTKMVNFSVRLTATQRQDETSISLLQLAEVVKRLDEDEFRFLLSSKDSTPNASLGHTGSLLMPEYNFSEALERCKEQLYLENITKDISILQHMEHSKIDLDYKISMLNASLNESKNTNKCLAEQLAQSQSELQAVTKDREDLQYKYQAVEIEMTEFSSKVRELQDELEISHRASLGLSLGLSDCKNLVDALRVENSNVSGSLTLAMEDKINLEGELVKCNSLLRDAHVANSELSRNLSSVTEEWKKLEGEKDYLLCENEKLLSRIEAIEMEKSNFSGNLALMTEEMKKLEEQKHHFVCESDRLRSDLEECHNLLKALQVEKDNLSEGISFVTDEKRKLEEGNENIIIENKSLFSELCVHQELLSVSQTKNLQLEAERRKMNLRFEDLVEQNIMLDCRLLVHKATIMEINHIKSQLTFHSKEASNQIESRDQASRVPTDLTNDDDFQQISGGKDGYKGPKQLEQNVYSDGSVFPNFNRHLEEADKVIQKLEKAIEEMHSHSVSLSRLGGKGTAPGVSKLIQAFETKTHLEDGEVEENHIIEDRSNVDSFRLSKHQTSNLRAVLMELQLEANNASQILQGERNDREVASVAYTDLNILYEAVREHTEILEATNIELEVQYEAVKQHACNNEEMKRELVVLYESLQQENITLNAQNTDLGKNLNDFHVRINELESQLEELQQSSEGVASSISSRIDNLRSEAVGNLEAVRADHEAMTKELNGLREKNDLAVGILNKIFENVMEQVIDLSNGVDESETHLQNNEPLDPFNTRRYEHLMDQLGALLGERLHLKLENNKLQTELASRTKETEELNKQCLDLNVVMKLIEDVEAIIDLEVPIIDLDKPIVSRLDFFVRFLLQRYTEADDRVNLAREELGSKLIALSEQQEKINQLDSLNLSQTNEIASLKESLSEAEEAIVAVRSELQVKAVEVEQSEQRVSSVKEKLSIAVAKGKGLVIQRDNLKQSLSDTSTELEMKDAKIHEVEEKLKMYSEAGERVEALESELSYIRNSATALRESFLLKDSVLQRIEEILEDLELPENFHTRDIIEKVDWLARSVTGNSLPQIDWDQTSSNLGDDLRKKYEEIQGKFYELAEQNEMLEQSLMERNNLVQRWEEVLDRIDMPTQLRSMEPEDRIDWLRSEISEAHQYTNTLQQKIDNLENHCGTLTVDLEESHRRLSEAESDLRVVTHDKENLSKSLETLTCDLEKMSDQAVQFELANHELQSEITSFQAKLGDASLDDVRNRDTFGAEKPDVLFLKKNLEDALSDLTRVKDERDSCMEKHQFLVLEFEAVNKKMEELQDLLGQEEKKSASAREKLNVAVRKGKSLVQQRDSMKQIIEERNSEVVSLRSENLSLSNHLTETQHHLQEKGHNLVLILNTLGKIDLGDEFKHSDPVVRLEQLGKLLSELHAAVAFSEQESRKSKRAAELLLEELNEVQERNDILQEDLAKASNELLALKKNKHADFMALKHSVHQVRGSFFDVNTLIDEVLIKDTDFLHKLEANIEFCIKSSGANVPGLPLVNAHGAVSAFLQHKEEFLARESESEIERQEYFDGHDGVEGRRDAEHDLQGFATEINALKEKIRKHSFSLNEMSEKLTTALEIILREFTSQTESVISLKKDIVSFESLEKEKDIESVFLRKNMSVLYEACTSSIMEIENKKGHLFGNSVSDGDVGIKLKTAAMANGGHLLSGKALLSSEGLIRTIADGLLILVKEMGYLEAEMVDGKQMEMKTTISNLQKELQEKDMQKERICMELVSQIREAKASAASYSDDFQSAKNRLEVVDEERASLEQKVKELEDGEATSIELQKRVSSMTEMVAAKDQEIESLMQALDEEELQMGELGNKISELEKVVCQKNIDLENLEASKGKAMKKLSITVNKFDELHNLSDNLLAEVEKLQSQLQDRDSEISFLRQEVTRCTNDVLIASQMSNKMNSEEMHELLTWLGTMISRVQEHDVCLDELKDSQIHEFKEVLQKQITSVISELEDLRATAQSKDSLLEVERSRVEELTRKGNAMEKSLRQKEVQLDTFKNSPESRGEISTSTEIVEVEPLINKWAVPGTSIANKVRSLRKVNNDQVAIDMDPTNIMLEDEEDDKVHGFKSLTTSRIIPRFTRPVTDMIDGLWVSCDRALMRQPALRLGIIIYWAVLHALFATFVV